MAKQFRIRLKRSLIGTTKRQQEMARCLGLRKVNSEAVIQDNPANRGQILGIQHLLEVKVETK
jgi:large subunit ribosomal protein L30